jgi:hypothetical protein
MASGRRKGFKVPTIVNTSVGTVPEAVLLHPAASLAGGARANSLNLPVVRDATAPPAARREALLTVIATLHVESARRYKPKPKPGPTWCNVYAHDFARIAGVYIPRVWWTDDALAHIAAGRQVIASYGTTVHERSAAELLLWMTSWGSRFGWEILYDGTPVGDATGRDAAITRAQEGANSGKVATVIAFPKAHLHGHIVMVAPEDESADAPEALRRSEDEHGDDFPVQSQAGRNLIARSSRRGAWWRDGDYTRVVFALHE